MRETISFISVALFLFVAFHAVNSSDEKIKANDAKWNGFGFKDILGGENIKVNDAKWEGFGLKDILGDDRLPKLTVDVLKATLKENGGISDDILKNSRDPEINLNAEGIVKRWAIEASALN